MKGIEIIGDPSEARLKILTTEALNFVADLHREFALNRKALLANREEIQAKIDSGNLPDFLHATEYIRNGEWKVAPIPKELEPAGAEITGPASNAKMVINALNSGAEVYMADAEDSESPTFHNILQGQANLREAVAGTLTYETKKKKYQLNEKTAVLMFRPRGLHLPEKHIRIDDEPISASLFDFGMYFFHNARSLLEKGTAPYFYLPKMENAAEARFWHQVFLWSEDRLVIPRGTIKATVLIETILAAFEMEEILYALRDHVVGLNCGRWDYIFSYIKKFRKYPKFVLPDRSQLAMDQGFLAPYVDLLSKVCHKRGALPIGGMSACIPIKNDPEANAVAMVKVRADKAIERKKRMRRAWVAHPDLVPIVQEIMKLEVSEEDFLNLDQVAVTAKDLLQVPSGEITEDGLRKNIRVGIEYLEAWYSGTGCVPINNLMEDAATAEISRSQIWQWLKYSAELREGGKVTVNLVRDLIQDEIKNREIDKFDYAAIFFDKLVTLEKFEDFLTLPAYEFLLEPENRKEVASGK